MPKLGCVASCRSVLPKTLPWKTMQLPPSSFSVTTTPLLSSSLHMSASHSVTSSCATAGLKGRCGVRGYLLGGLPDPPPFPIAVLAAAVGVGSCVLDAVSTAGWQPSGAVASSGAQPAGLHASCSAHCDRGQRGGCAIWQCCCSGWPSAGCRPTSGGGPMQSAPIACALWRFQSSLRYTKTKRCCWLVSMLPGRIARSVATASDADIAGALPCNGRGVPLHAAAGAVAAATASAVVAWCCCAAPSPCLHM
mmetsp:Transcript_14181/g.41225  ORF Transcript_14181/g.41225 Transcript_14181/m.41225 type:complete len:250 (-) Transcript_14181:2495-3244(-)